MSVLNPSPLAGFPDRVAFAVQQHALDPCPVLNTKRLRGVCSLSSALLLLKSQSPPTFTTQETRLVVSPLYSQEHIY